MRILLKNGEVIHKEKTKQDILIVDGIIVDIGSDLIDQDAIIIDCEGYVIAPGFIDMHVHLREPGYENKETVRTGTAAAAKGGYTTICPMPNTNPVIDDIDKLMEIKKIIEKNAVVNVLPYASINKNLRDHHDIVDMEVIHEHVAGFSNDGVGVQSPKHMYQAMQKANQYEALIAAHCEDESILFGGYVHQGIRSKANGWESMTSLPESLQIARDVLIAEETDCRYHVCHISTKEGIRIIKDAKQRGQKVTCEVTPHHLLLTSLDVADTNFKMNPPLRGIDDKYALIQALLEGTIDCIATDHAPHLENEKNQSMKDAPFGIIGLETAFPLIYTHLVRSNMASLGQAIEWFSINPAKILNLRMGYLVKGRQADVTIVDLNTRKVIDKHTFLSKGRNTPFHGFECYGWPVMTIVKGKVVYQDARFNRKKK